MNDQLLKVLKAVSEKPELLKKEPKPDTLKRLQSQANKKAQGTGNKVTEQEGCFAEVLEEFGFVFQDKHLGFSDGFRYIYQRNGSQQEGDFSVVEISEGVVKKEVVLDLKHTGGKSFYLNDGWFQDEVIYVISWNAGTPKKPTWKTHIALGKDIPSKEEQAFMTELQAFKKDKNSGTKKVGSLRPYVRFANQYSCERFLEQEGKSLSMVVNVLCPQRH